MKKTPERNPPKNLRSGSDPRIRAEFRDQLTEFLTAKLTETPQWPGIKYDDFIFGLIDAVVQSSKAAPNGMGIGIRQMLAIELMERVNAEDDEDSLSTADPITHPLNSSKTTNSISNAIMTWDDTDSWKDESVLHKNGYSVAEGGLSEGARRAVLAGIFAATRLLDVSDQVGSARWGKASSGQRLYAMSKFIAWLARFQGSALPVARTKWLDDLTWLKEQFYRSAMEFDWPVVDNLPSIHRTAKRSPNDAFMEALTPSPALAIIIGTSALPRTEVVSRLWMYIKKNDLQDKLNKRMINADENLKQIFGKSQVSMFEMAGLLGKHLRT